MTDSKNGSDFSVGATGRKLRALEDEVARLREALRWHADSMNYTIEAPTWDQDEVIENSVNHAREALRQGDGDE